ncbi:hypothetical protein GPECTOR_208g401 [Gonium pectorale]|uniref:Uncharacterized protein n=1 Tax=Gonium pectorale TaxID=33097 RepID=A0A150FWW2_GONPE|nr:hypothetical protein GPECTOR_208g401 [Gonium pectorale]|eukprot:KXZ42089.1 hypothetical protein GPECTOR_208g401 [Gonium pectorale]
MQTPPFELARNLQAACAVARSFLGPHRTHKCVIDPSSDARSCIVGTAQAFLLAAHGDPTATTLLLEAMESQAPSPSDSTYGNYGPGSGATWLAAFCGLLTGRLLELVAGQGLPLEAARAGLLAAVAECCQAVRGCALDLQLVSEQWDERELLSYHQGVAALVLHGDAGGGEDGGSGGVGVGVGQEGAPAAPTGPMRLAAAAAPGPVAAAAVAMADGMRHRGQDVDCGGDYERDDGGSSGHGSGSSSGSGGGSGSGGAAPWRSDGSASGGGGEALLRGSPLPPPSEESSSTSGGSDDGGGRGGAGAFDDDDDGGEAEAALRALESEVSWFFGAGELEAERAARAQRRALARAAPGLEAALAAQQ